MCVTVYVSVHIRGCSLCMVVAFCKLSFSLMQAAPMMNTAVHTVSWSAWLLSVCQSVILLPVSLVTVCVSQFTGQSDSQSIYVSMHVYCIQPYTALHPLHALVLLLSVAGLVVAHQHRELLSLGGGEFTWKKGESYFCNLLGGKMNLIFVQPIDMHSDTDALSPSVRIACRVEQSACQCCGLLWIQSQIIHEPSLPPFSLLPVQPPLVRAA